MRYAITLGLLVVGLGWPESGAAQADVVDFSVRSYLLNAPPGNSGPFRVNCPSSHVPLYATIPNRSPTTVRIGNRLVDVPEFGGPPLNFRGGGYEISVTNSGVERYEGSFHLFCGRLDALSTTTVPFQRTLPPGETTFLPPLSCPAGLVPVGVVTNADGFVISEQARVYLLTFLNALQSFTSVPDGTYAAPSAWGLGYRNDGGAPVQLTGQLFCANLPNAQTNVVSTNVVGGALHSLFAGVPDDFDLVGNSYVVSGSEENDVLYWADGTAITYEDILFLAEPSGVWLDGKGVSAPQAVSAKQVVGRAVIGSLLVPSKKPVPSPTTVTIVEFYNAALDHYFITANAKEIGDLDTGVHRGWARTGESFNAYGVGSSGRTGRRPVCRAYGNPAAGLDSHFYSAVPRECIATIRNFGDDWLLESTDVFDIELPDTSTGACPADRVAIYRLWNGRVDSSHRFVRTLALRAQMIARGFVSEGYGPNGVVFCALP